MKIKAQVRITHDNNKFWFLPGTELIHREDGPAVEWDHGGREWWIQGNLHREDGPAVIWPDGTVRWYLDGVRVDAFEHFLRCLSKKIDG